MVKHTSLVLILLAGAAAQAATTSTTLTVNATVSISSTSLAASGTATLTSIGNGTFSATVPLTGLTGTTVNAPYTITLSGSTLTGTISLPLTLLEGTSTTATGSATVTGGTGSFAGATGSFPSLSGSGSIGVGGISITFSGAGTINTGGTTGPPVPTITQVADAAAYGSSIAEGSIFIVKGSNLSASGFNQFGFPLPTSSPDGVSVKFTPVSGGTATSAYLIYTYNQNGVNQIAAVLPSTLAAASYNVTVTNGTTSAPFPTTVVQRRFALFTQDSTGGGLVVVQNFISATQLDVNRLTTGSVSGISISPAKPGQTLIAWGTGMGPVTGGDNVASPGFDFSHNGVTVQVMVGGMAITPAYAGRAPGLAAEDQINFTLPSNVPTGCTVSFQLSVNGVLSNATYISIAPSASADACVQPGFTTAQLQGLDQGTTYNAGSFILDQFSESLPSVGNVKIDLASGSFTQYSAFELGSVPALQTPASASGTCQVVQISSSNSTSGLFSGTGIALDAGTVTLNGPSGSNITNAPLTEFSNSYSLLIGEEGAPTAIPGILNGTLVAGTYTLSGAGGKDVGKFTASLTLGTPLTITGGLPTTVTRSAGLTLNWTGGNPADLVVIVGTATMTTGTGSAATTTGAGFVCETTVGAGTFTVPSSILTQLPAVSAAAVAASTGSTVLEVATSTVATAGNGIFSAPLTAGGTINNATFQSLLGALSQPAYQ
ncbi:MAG TPA: hypothetical protein VE959_14215 [Bryobacteraceae bacterium]|nr:hypothetical protein [Bryobacteraceae bacterium]